MEIAVGSQPGRRRYGGDAYRSESVGSDVALVAVADAFGSARGNAIAHVALSAMAEVLRRRLRAGLAGRTEVPGFLRAVMLSAFSSANARVFAQSGNHDDCVAGGASLTAAIVTSRHVVVGHVGESRAYLVREGEMTSLTADDTLHFEPARNVRSVIPVEPPHRTLLTRTLGTQPTLEATVMDIELRTEDQFLICTDGIHRNVTPAELCTAVLSAEGPADAVASILFVAREREAADCGTVIVARNIPSTVDLGPDAPETAERIRRGATIAGMVSVLVVIAVLLLVYGIHV